MVEQVLVSNQIILAYGSLRPIARQRSTRLDHPIIRVVIGGLDVGTSIIP